VVEPQGVVEGVHFTVIKHADPVVQLSDIDAQHLLKEYAAFPAVDLGFWSGEAGPGRGGGGGDGHDRADEVRSGDDDRVAPSLLGVITGTSRQGNEEDRALTKQGSEPTRGSAQLLPARRDR